MTDDVALSVVIPTYNRASSLERLLRALDAQEPVPGGFEVIVVDDGSTDGTSEVAARHPGVRHVHQSNAGPAAARNRGWRTARGKVVAFTDDDTIPDRRWLADLVAAFAETPAPDALGGNIVPLQPNFIGDFMQHDHLVGHGVDVSGVKYLVTANAAYRTDVLLALNGFDETFRRASGEDTDLTLRTIAAGYRVAVIPTATVAHDNPTSLWSLLKTYQRHGSSRSDVVRANPDAGWGQRRWAVLGPRQWMARYTRYRSAGCGRGRALAYLLVRAVGLVAYVSGLAQRLVNRSGRAPQTGPAR